MRIIVVAVGKLRPPFADDVQHYQKLLAGHTRLELVEVREDDQVARRLPDRAFVSLLHRDGQKLDSLAFARFLEERRQSGRDLCFVIGGPFGLDARRRRPPPVAGRDDAAPPARPRRAAGAALQASAHALRRKTMPP